MRRDPIHSLKLFCVAMIMLSLALIFLGTGYNNVFKAMKRLEKSRNEAIVKIVEIEPIDFKVK